MKRNWCVVSTQCRHGGTRNKSIAKSRILEQLRAEKKSSTNNARTEMSKFLFARQRVSVADLAAIAAGGAQCALDTAVADKLAAAWAESESKEARNAKPGAATVALDALPPACGDGDACAHLSYVESRALMAARLMSLLHGRVAVRPTALHLIVGACHFALSLKVLHRR